MKTSLKDAINHGLFQPLIHPTQGRPETILTEVKEYLTAKFTAEYLSIKNPDELKRLRTLYNAIIASEKG